MLLPEVIWTSLFQSIEILPSKKNRRFVFIVKNISVTLTYVYLNQEINKDSKF